MSAAEESIRNAKMPGTWASVGRHAGACPGSRGERVLHDRCCVILSCNTITAVVR